LKPAAFSDPVVGMDVDVLDENGNAIKNAVSVLVIRQPWIGMTRGFRKDDQRYLDTY
jgi:acetyl-CoA synthetase